MNQIAAARSFEEGFDDGSMIWEGGASSAIAASAEVSLVTALISRFSKSSNILFIFNKMHQLALPSSCLLEIQAGVLSRLLCW